MGVHKNSIWKLFTLISPPSAFVAKLSTPNLYPEKYLQELVIANGCPSFANVLPPSRLYEKVAVYNS